MKKSILVISICSMLISVVSVLVVVHTRNNLNKKMVFKNVNVRLTNLRNYQEQFSEKTLNCWKDKTCYDEPSVNKLISNLWSEAQFIDGNYVDNCPEIKSEMENYLVEIKNVYDSSSHLNAAKEFTDQKVPEKIEVKTKSFLNLWLKVCKN